MPPANGSAMAVATGTPAKCKQRSLVQGATLPKRVYLRMRTSRCLAGLSLRYALTLCWMHGVHCTPWFRNVRSMACTAPLLSLGRALPLQLGYSATLVHVPRLLLLLRLHAATGCSQDERHVARHWRTGLSYTASGPTTHSLTLSARCSDHNSAQAAQSLIDTSTPAGRERSMSDCTDSRVTSFTCSSRW